MAKNFIFKAVPHDGMPSPGGDENPRRTNKCAEKWPVRASLGWLRRGLFRAGLFLAILATIGIFYWGFQNNYFFSDDFAWLGRAVLVQDSPGEIFKVEGRDFNPVFLALLGFSLKIFGLSPLVFRVISLLTFSAVTWIFFYILSRFFRVNRIIAVSAALLFGCSGFVSEVVLNLAALVYSLSLGFALAALTFYFSQVQPAAANKIEYHREEQKGYRPSPLHQRFPGLGGKKSLFLFFLILAFLTKETIILAALPLFLYEKDKNSRIFIVVSTGVMVLSRVLLQMTAAAGSYTNFLSFSNFFYKLYFIILRTLNLSPYSMPLPVGILVIILLLLVSLYFSKAEKGIMFFLGFWVIFSVVFALLPKLSSRYFLYPTLGFWGIAALMAHYFYKKKEYLKYALVPLLLISLFFNYPLIKREIEDYRILGDFSRDFIRAEKVAIENQQSRIPPPVEITLYKGDERSLAEVYRRIIERDNLPKLLPFRAHSIGGVIEPKHLIPIIFHPDRIARWHQVRDTSSYFKGRITE